MTEKYSLTPDSYGELKDEVQRNEGLKLSPQSAEQLGVYSNSLLPPEKEKQVGFFTKITEAIKGRIK